MYSFDFITYFGCGAICFTLGVVLLGTIMQETDMSSLYIRAKRLSAYCAFINVIVDVVVLILHYKYGDFAYLQQFFLPMMYYIQFGIMTFVMLSLIYSKKVSPKNVLLLGLPVFAIAGTYIIFALTDKEANAMQMPIFIAFARTQTAYVLSMILYAIIFCELSYCAFLLIRETRAFCKKIDNYFSVQQEASGRKLTNLSYIVSIYFLLVAIDFFWTDSTIDVVLMWVNTAIFTFASIMVLNLRSIFFQVHPAISLADEVQEDESDAKVIITTDTSADDSATTDPEAGEPKASKDIATLITEWAKRDDKPYLQEGLSITNVAEQINVRPRLLSEYLNNIRQINFNQWINRMRIDEAKHIIATEPDTTLLDVAIRSGFSDRTTMGRVFKQLTDKSPSEYQAEVAQTRNRQ